MIHRHLSKQIIKYAKEYPLVAIVGPRQSGKTTLAKALFPKYRYISLENLDMRDRAAKDPRGFLEDFGSFLILDEVQRVPELFSYLQERVDNDQTPAQYILTGSSQFLLIEKITQSLAGRIVTFKLFPLTFTELFQYDEEESFLVKRHSQRKKVSQDELFQLIWEGFYPRIHDKHLDSFKWQENYIFTYVERDIRSLLNIKNLRTFEHFLKLSASSSGQLINLSNFSNALGISVTTVKEWISLLETSGLIFILPPYFENFSKRIVKTAKLYFVDTGLLCHLLGIREVQHLKTHPLLGSIFETFIVSECFKRFHNLGEVPPLYFWRDQVGTEIDLLVHRGQVGFPIEIKMAGTYHSDFKKSIEKYLSLPKNPADRGLVLYCGEHALHLHSPIPTFPWYQI